MSVASAAVRADPVRIVRAGLRLPVIVAPMFLVSGPEMVIAAGLAGLLGAFPAANARTTEDLALWLDRIAGDLALAGRGGQWAVNMIVHRTYARCDAELELLARYRPRLVITSLGSPARVLDRVHGFGGMVFGDVIDTLHARKAVDAGCDGLVLIAAGAGGHTGAISPFAFVDEVRRFWDGPLVLGGAIASGRAVKAAITLGADFAYMGTRFIAARESLCSDNYRNMLIRADAAAIVGTAAISGVRANWLRESLEQANFDFSGLDSRAKVDFSGNQAGNRAWRNIWSAGQAVGQVTRIEPLADIADALIAEYADCTGEL